MTEIPIDPGSLREEWLRKADGDAADSDTHAVITGQMSIRSEAFVAIRELARLIILGTDWLRKARIVLEYDPRQSKLCVTSFTESDEPVMQGDDNDQCQSTRDDNDSH